MKSNYKKLGKYIQQVSIRNSDLTGDVLLGVSIQKILIPSIANIVGTDMSTYKKIKKNQFAYGPVTSRNGDKISIAICEVEKAILSQAYTIFEIIDENELLPEYLMMWFRRAEFDRYARFKSHGSARETFDWDEMCEIELPVPKIEKQLEIVNEYKTIQNRIKLNENLIQKLEETAQAIYKKWFVEFEFPNEEGFPYKSAGGEMVESELGEIPKGWEIEKLGNLIESFSKKHNFKKDKLIFFNTSDILNGEFLHAEYSLVSEMPGQAKKQIQKNDILYSEIRPANKRFALVRNEASDYVVSTKLMVLRLKNKKLSVFRIFHLLTEDSFILQLQQSAEGKSGTFPQITFEEDLQEKLVLVALNEVENKWNKFLESYYKQWYSRKDENKVLKSLKELILQKMTKVEI